MNALSALYNTYNIAEKSNFVDRTDLIKQKTVLLPIFHTNKRSKGNDIVQISLKENGDFIKADWVPKDDYIIFPISENSIVRSSGVASHPLSDELSYLSKEIDPKKHEDYINKVLEWSEYTEKYNYNQTFTTIKNYILKETVLKDVIRGILGEVPYTIIDGSTVVYKDEKQNEKNWKLSKVFITFLVETPNSIYENYTVSTDDSLHNNYIEYIKQENKKKPQTMCNISNELTYCVPSHRGILGNSKLISVSNNNETYYGRFKTGEEITSIGYETSQKIHLMLKYLLENKNNTRWLGSSSYLVNWFSDDIQNEQDIQFTSSISMDDKDEIEDDLELDFEENVDANASFGGQLSKMLNDYLSGKESSVSIDSKFYVLIVDKISNGRVSIKYFRELSKSDLIERAGKWYKSTCWTNYNYITQKNVSQSPSLYQLADYIEGREVEDRARAQVKCKNEKLRTKTIERLIPCILEEKKFPLDLVRKMYNNLCNRKSYSTTWNSVVCIGCSVIKKYKMDYEEKREVSDVLDTENLERSYLYGRLLAVYEKLERDALDGNKLSNEGASSKTSENSKRSTNAERLWTVYTKTPARTLMIIEDKIRPYKERLQKSRPSSYIYYDNLSGTIINRLSETIDFENEKNKPLNENFIFGYYAQKQEFYKKRDNK